VSDELQNEFRECTVSGWAPETFSLGIKRTEGSHPKEKVSGVQPADLAHSPKFKCPPADTDCQVFGLICGIRCSGMAPCGPLYSLRSVCRRQGLARSRLFGVGEPMRNSPYKPCKIKSELLQLAHQLSTCTSCNNFSNGKYSAVLIGRSSCRAMASRYCKSLCL